MRRVALLVVLLGLVSCNPESAIVPPPIEEDRSDPDIAEPELAILDGSREGGNPGFHFQPPIVRSIYRPTGEFASDLHEFLSVEICEWDGVACVGDPVSTFTHDGEHGERLHKLQVLKTYVAFWNTRRDDLDPDKLYRIIVKAGPVELGYADVDILRRLRDAKDVDHDEFVPLPDDWTLPIAFTVEEGALEFAGGALVGPNGGSAQSSGGGDMSVSIPPGVLDAPALLTIKVLRWPPSVPSDWLAMDRYYEIDLSGGTLSGEVTVEFRIRDDDGDGLVDGELLPPTSGALRVFDPAVGWTTPHQSLDLQTGSIFVTTDHFSPWSFQFGPLVRATGNGGFVYIDGGAFRQGTTADIFPLVGANAYELARLGPTDMRKILDRAQQELGATTVRVWAFPGHDPDVVSVLREAHARGMKVIFALINNWSDFGGVGSMDEMVSLRTCQELKSGRRGDYHDAFYTDPICRQEYKRHVRDLVDRVKKSPYGTALLAWELANEPGCHARTEENPGALAASAECDSEDADPIVQWVTDMSKYVRQVDSVHLVAAGAEGLSDQMLLRIATETPVDFSTVHIYPDYQKQNTDEQTATAYFKSRIDAGARASLFGHKPVIVEEFGVTNSNVALFAGRDALYAEWLAYANARVDGWLVWHLLKNPADDGEDLALERPRDDATIVAVYEAACDARSATRVSCAARPTPSSSLFDDFNDGDFTSNPAWSERNLDDYPGVVSVQNGALRFFRTGAGSNGASLGVEMNVDIPVTDDTRVVFDALAAFRSVTGGCGFQCGEYPANVQLTLHDAAGGTFYARYAVNYGTAVQDQATGDFRQFARSIPQNTWVRDLAYRVRDAWPSAVRVSHVLLFGAGWDLEGYIDNVRIQDMAPPPGGSTYREDFDGTGIPSGWVSSGGSWTVGGGVLTGSDPTSTGVAALNRQSQSGPPTVIRTRVLNTAGLPWGAAGLTFNWTSSSDHFVFLINTDAPTGDNPISASIGRTSGGVSEGLVTCPRTSLVQRNAFYVLELRDTPTGLLGRVLDESGVQEICSMDVPGIRLTGDIFGVVAVWAGGNAVVDWIETN